MHNLRAARFVVAACAKLALAVLLVGLVATLLIQLAPGFGSDERELDFRFSNEYIDQIRQEAPREGVLASYYSFLRDAGRGDLGFSRSLNLPVTELIQQRYRTTLRILGSGWALGWLPAMFLAAAGAVFQARAIPLAGTVAGAAILCVPAAFLAYLCFVVRVPAFVVVALVIFARVFRILDNLFRNARQKTYVIAARSQGLREWRIWVSHIVPCTLAEMVALAGSSVSMAIGATIAAEALCDQPGLGQLAWKAALARDFPLLVSLTLLIGTVTLTCNRAADTFIRIRGNGAA